VVSHQRRAIVTDTELFILETLPWAGVVNSTMRPTNATLHPSMARVIFSYVVAVVCVALATLLTFPIRSISVHSLSLLFMVAVLISSWHGGTWPGLISVVLATGSFEFFFSTHAGSVGLYWADVLRLGVFAGVAVAIASLTAHRRTALLKEQRAAAELQSALEEIKVLRGILPICMYCKQIRNDAGRWQQVEQYVSEHSDAAFSHGVCPECYKKLHPEIYKEHNSDAGKTG